MCRAVTRARNWTAALLAAALSLSARGIADDTEIYFTTAGAGQPQGVRPNVLFILDTSGSMTRIVQGTNKTRLDTMKDALRTVLQTTNNINAGLMRFSDPGGPILFPVANIDAPASDIEGEPDATLVQTRISDGADDVEEVVGSGTLILDDMELQLVDDVGGNGQQIVGLRFQNVNVPQGVTVVSAVIQFTAADADTDPASLTFYGEASDNSLPFSATNKPSDTVQRPRTLNSVTWDGASTPALDGWTLDAVYESPDLKDIVQEIIDRSGWCGGNAMTFIIEGTGERTAYAYESQPAMAPVLVIDYDIPTDAGGNPVGGCYRQTVSAQVNKGNDDAEERPNGNVWRNSSDLELMWDQGNQRAVGVRFAGLAIPQGATILSAELEFEIDERETRSTNLTIRGEAVDDAASFTSATNDITNRPTTTASVAWDNVPAPGVNEKLVSPDISAIVQEIVDRPGWAAGNAMVFIITGTGERVVESYNGEPAAAPVLRVRYQSTVSAGAGGIIKTVRQRLIELVDELIYKTYTPIVDTLYEAALYYRGEAADYGKKRGDPDPWWAGDRREFTRVSHPGSYTGGTVDREPGCTDANLNAVACRTEHIDGTPVYISPITESCQTNFIVLLSDGVPTKNYSVSKVESMIGTTCADTSNQYAKCTNELGRFLYEQDQSGSLDGDQIIRTYTIGFNFDGDPQYLKDLAAAGGGRFFTAEQEQELVDVLEQIISEALSAPSSFSAPTLSVNAFNRLFHRNSVYFALFKPDNRQRWIGNIKKFELCDGTSPGCDLGEVIDRNGDPAIDPATNKIKDSAQSFWGAAQPDGPNVDEGGAGEQVWTHTLRNVYTYTGAEDSPAVPVNLETDGNGAHHVKADNTLITKEMLGDPNMTDQEREDILNWMRGQDVKDENNNGDTTDDRWSFTDPLHSRPITVNYGFVDNDPDRPIAKIFVGTNDGGLRMINEATGEEEWIFYPPAVLDRQKALMDNAAGDHIYGLDGTPTVWIQDRSLDTGGQVVDVPDGVIDPSIGDFVRIFIGMRRGGRNLYALDVTPSTVLTSTTLTAGTASIDPKFMWRIKGGEGDFAQLADTWPRPRVTEIRMGTGQPDEHAPKTVLIFGGGYDTNQDPLTPNSNMADGDEIVFGPDGVGNAIYIVDPTDGSLIWWASGVGSGATLELPGMDYSIPGDITFVDSNGDGATDRLYAVDMGGQVWRIDLSPRLKVNNNGTNPPTAGARLAAISDYSPNPAEADKRKMFYKVDVIKVRDELFSPVQQDYDIVAVATGNRAHPLDLDVQNRIYAFRDYLIDSPITLGASGDPTNYPLCNNNGVLGVCGGPLTEADLYDATDNVLSESDLQDSTGWFIKLQEADGSWIGEKGLSRPITLNGVLYLTTYIPTQASQATDACTGAEGTGRLYALNLLTGEPVIDFNNSGSLTRSDRYLELGGGIPSEVVPVIQEQGMTVLIGTGAGAVSFDPEEGLPWFRTFWYQE